MQKGMKTRRGSWLFLQAVSSVQLPQTATAPAPDLARHDKLIGNMEGPSGGAAASPRSDLYMPDCA